MDLLPQLDDILARGTHTRERLESCISHILAAPDNRRDLFAAVLSRLKSRSAAYEAQAARVRVAYGIELQNAGEFAAARDALSQIPLHTTALPPDTCVDVACRTAELSLFSFQEPHHAESALNQVAGILGNASRGLQYRHTQLVALSQGASRRFPDASSKLLDLIDVAEEVYRATDLENHAALFLLATPLDKSSMKLHLLARLHPSDNLHPAIADAVRLTQQNALLPVALVHSLCSVIPHICHAVISNALLGGIPPFLELKALTHASGLPPDCLACISLGRAIMQHNLLVLSSVYMTISFSRIGGLLELPPVVCKALAMSLISMRVLSARLDAESVSFTTCDPALAWDRNVASSINLL